MRYRYARSSAHFDLESCSRPIADFTYSTTKRQNLYHGYFKSNCNVKRESLFHMQKSQITGLKKKTKKNSTSNIY